MSDWVPVSGFNKAGGYTRLVDKVRHMLAGDAGEYYALEASPIDQAALRGWRVTADQMRGWVQAGLSDDVIAQRVRETGGVDPETFNRLWVLAWGGPMLVFEADEGRMAGPAAGLLKGIAPVFLGVRRLLVTVGVTKEA
jgi:hypothetical protein